MGTLRKLTREEYEQVQTQYDLANENAMIGGDHMILMALLRRLGYSEVSRESVMRLSSKLLAMGWT